MKLQSYEHFMLERRRVGDSQEDAAVRHGVTQGCISQWETAARGLPAELRKQFPARAVKMTPAEDLFILMTRAGLTLSDAQVFFSVDLRRLYRWLKEEEKIPPAVFTMLHDRLD
jgi:hypothetical protein